MVSRNSPPTGSETNTLSTPCPLIYTPTPNPPQNFVHKMQKHETIYFFIFERNTNPHSYQNTGSPFSKNVGNSLKCEENIQYFAYPTLNKLFLKLLK